MNTIKELKDKGFNNDSIYQLIVGNLNLFGLAFFGHKGTKSEKAKLNYWWKKIINS